MTLLVRAKGGVAPARVRVVCLRLHEAFAVAEVQFGNGADGSVKSGLANYPVQCGLAVASYLRFWPPSFVPYTHLRELRDDPFEFAVDGGYLVGVSRAPGGELLVGQIPAAHRGDALFGGHLPQRAEPAGARPLGSSDGVPPCVRCGIGVGWRHVC